MLSADGLGHAPLLSLERHRALVAVLGWPWD
jgi:hypothetical protein